MTWIKSTCPYCTSTDDHHVIGFCLDTKIADMECTDCDQEYIADFKMVVSNERVASAKIQIEQDQGTAACPYCKHVVNILIDDDASDFEAYTACENSECRGIFKMTYKSPSIVIDEKEFIRAGGSLGEGLSIPVLKRKVPESIFLREKLDAILEDLSNNSTVGSTLGFTYFDPEKKEFTRIEVPGKSNLCVVDVDNFLKSSEPSSAPIESSDDLENVNVLFCDETTGKWEAFKATGFHAEELKKVLEPWKGEQDDAKDD